MAMAGAICHPFFDGKRLAYSLNRESEYRPRVTRHNTTTDDPKYGKEEGRTGHVTLIVEAIPVLFFYGFFMRPFQEKSSAD